MVKHFDRARILLEQGRYELAEKEVREEIATNPNFDGGYTTLALCLINQGKLTTEVLESIEYALSIDAENDWSYYVTTGRTKRALVNSQAALQIDPNNAIAHKWQGLILIKLGRYSDVIDHFRSALSIDPTFKEAKEGLLEAMRSQYWIYPWISMTNWRGKLSFFLAFPDRA